MPQLRPATAKRTKKKKNKKPHNSISWKQAKCPSTEERIKKMWYLYTMEYYSAIKRNEIMPFAVIWVDLEIVILSEVSQQRRRNIV